MPTPPQLYPANARSAYQPTALHSAAVMPWTNRLRRKFDPTPNYLETKVQMKQVMDSARRVTQVMTKGNCGTQAERYWVASKNINDLARCYKPPFIGS